MQRGSGYRWQYRHRRKQSKTMLVLMGEVGIGPGSICTFGILAGIGVPQVTAIAVASIKGSGISNC